MLSRRDLCLQQEQKRFFIHLRNKTLFVFLILGVPLPHGNHQSKVSQFSSQTSQRSSFKIKVISIALPARRLFKRASCRQPAFQLDMMVDRPILLLGMAVFLPHGENIQGDVSIFVGACVNVCDEASEETTREMVSLPIKQTILLEHTWAKLCCYRWWKCPEVRC